MKVITLDLNLNPKHYFYSLLNGTLWGHFTGPCSDLTVIVPYCHTGRRRRWTAAWSSTAGRQSDKISHIDMGDNHIDIAISHISSPHSISIPRMTISMS